MLLSSYLDLVSQRRIDQPSRGLILFQPLNGAIEDAFHRRQDALLRPSGDFKVQFGDRNARGIGFDDLSIEIGLGADADGDVDAGVLHGRRRLNLTRDANP